MIHLKLYKDGKSSEHDGDFISEMNRINRLASLNITTHHYFFNSPNQRIPEFPASPINRSSTTLNHNMVPIECRSINSAPQSSGIYECDTETMIINEITSEFKEDAENISLISQGIKEIGLPNSKFANFDSGTQKLLDVSFLGFECEKKFENYFCVICRTQIQIGGIQMHLGMCANVSLFDYNDEDQIPVYKY